MNTNLKPSGRCVSEFRILEGYPVCVCVGRVRRSCAWVVCVAHVRGREDKRHLASCTKGKSMTGHRQWAKSVDRV